MSVSASTALYVLHKSVVASSPRILSNEVIASAAVSCTAPLGSPIKIARVIDAIIWSYISCMMLLMNSVSFVIFFNVSLSTPICLYIIADKKFLDFTLISWSIFAVPNACCLAVVALAHCESSVYWILVSDAPK